MPRRSLGEESSRSGTCKGPGVEVWLRSSGSERQLWSVHLQASQAPVGTWAFAEHWGGDALEF